MTVRTIPSQSSTNTYLRKLSLRQHRVSSLATKYARSEPNSPSTELRAYLQNATTGQTRYMIPSVGLPTDQPMPDSLTISGHSCQNLVMAGYPFCERRCSGTTDTCPAIVKSKLFLLHAAASQSTVAITGSFAIQGLKDQTATVKPSPKSLVPSPRIHTRRLDLKARSLLSNQEEEKARRTIQAMMDERTY
jgi:hypothetical protein